MANASLLESILEEYIDGLPNIAGHERLISDALADGRETDAHPVHDGRDPFEGISSAFAIALHMHQPLIPAGGDDLRTARLISHLQYMFEHPGVGDNYNARAFRWCYKRMGEFIPQLIEEGAHPRVMLDYSGTLLHGLRVMGAGDVLDALRTVTVEPRYRGAVEWLGCPWGHAVAPSTPVQDFRLHVMAWQHHFAGLFGIEALTRVRGFSPSEMALPNHPDVAYEFVRTLVECGYRWVLLQEHTLEQPDGSAVQQPHLPHRLVCTNSRGETASIIALVKTQGSDTKLVGQMQPYYEARELSRIDLAGHNIPPLVAQIGDGENGGVMMNEFPPKYFGVIRECSYTSTPIMNGSEYVERLLAAGIREHDLPVIQPLFQSRIWDRMNPGDGPQRLHTVIEDLRSGDKRFHMDGGSWTSEISWVRGYEALLAPMEQASAAFQQHVLASKASSSSRPYRNALFHLMTSETSCYRYWGQGQWTDYGAELARRTADIIAYDFDEIMVSRDGTPVAGSHDHTVVVEDAQQIESAVGGPGDLGVILDTPEHHDLISDTPEHHELILEPPEDFELIIEGLEHDALSEGSDDDNSGAEWIDDDDDDDDDTLTIEVPARARALAPLPRQPLVSHPVARPRGRDHRNGIPQDGLVVGTAEAAAAPPSPPRLKPSRALSPKEEAGIASRSRYRIGARYRIGVLLTAISDVALDRLITGYPRASRWAMGRLSRHAR